MNIYLKLKFKTILDKVRINCFLLKQNKVNKVRINCLYVVSSISLFNNIIIHILLLLLLYRCFFQKMNKVGCLYGEKNFIFSLSSLFCIWSNKFTLKFNKFILKFNKLYVNFIISNKLFFYEVKTIIIKMCININKLVIYQIEILGGM